MRAILIAISLAMAACAPEPVAGEARAALVLAAEAYERAQIDGDAATLGNIVADDYLLVGSDGSRQNKQELIAFWTAYGFDPEPVAISDPVELYWTDGAALGGMVTLRGMRNGAPFSVNIRYVDVWVLRDGAWVVVYGQTTRAE